MYFCLVNHSSAVSQAGVISRSLITELICVAVAFVSGIAKDWKYRYIAFQQKLFISIQLYKAVF